MKIRLNQVSSLVESVKKSGPKLVIQTVGGGESSAKIQCKNQDLFARIRAKWQVVHLYVHLYDNFMLPRGILFFSFCPSSFDHYEANWNLNPHNDETLSINTVLTCCTCSIQWLLIYQWIMITLQNTLWSKVTVADPRFLCSRRTYVLKKLCVKMEDPKNIPKGSLTGSNPGSDIGRSL